MPESFEKTQDQRIVLSGNWQHFKLLQKGYSEISPLANFEALENAHKYKW